MAQDLRDAFRSLVNDRAFAILAVLLLALTIGATTAVYAVVEAVILRPLAFGQQDRIVVVWTSSPQRNQPVIEVALGEMQAWSAQMRSFDASAVVGSVNWTTTVVDGDLKSRVPYSSVSASFFAVTGTQPLLGRVFEASDETGPAVRAAVLSHDFWMSRYGGEPTVIGRRVSIQEEADAPLRSVEIVGVMPAGFDYPRGAALWLPAAPGLRASSLRRRTDPEEAIAGLRVFYGLARLRPGVQRQSAQEEMSAVIGRLEPVTGTDSPAHAVLQPVDEYLLGPVKPVLWTLFAGAVLMLVIACTNVAALHVFRAARHDRALAIRLALGASRVRLVRQTLCESLLLAAAALVGAAFVASTCTRVLVLTAPIDARVSHRSRFYRPASLCSPSCSRS